MRRFLSKTERKRVPTPTVPLFTIAASAFASALFIYALPVALVNALFIEDITVYIEKVDIVRFKIKRGVRLLVEPVKKAELMVIVAGVAGSAIVSYVITHNALVFIYPVVSYAMIVYSLMYVPPDIRSEVEERKGSVMDEVVKRLPYLYLLFRVLYLKPRVVRVAREAGFIGASFYEFIRKTAGVFAIGTYISLATTPILYALLETYGFGLLALFVPLLVSLVLLYVPLIYIRMKRSSRASKISRNMLLILSYLCSTFSVSETFTNSIEYLVYTPRLSKMFGMDTESRIYINIYRVLGDESRAMEEYADTVPDDLFRDTIRSIRDIADNEGYGAVFRSLVTRLIDYTGRYIDRTKTTFENIGGNLISVVLLFQTALPIILFLVNPMMMPVMMIMGGVMSAFMIYIVAYSVMPDVPSDFIHMKPRLKVAALVFSLAVTGLTIVQYVLLPEFVTYFIPLNVGAGVSLALWYAHKEDFDLNNMFLNKFPDLLVLFSSSMTRTNAVERSLLELASQATFPEKMRASFRKLASVFALFNVERITYRGPFWYKYFMFLAGIAARYGTTPRDLYKAVGEFMLEFKKFFAHVKNYGRSLILLAVLSLVVMTVGIQIITDFMLAMQKAGFFEAVEQFGAESPIPVLSMEEVATMRIIGFVGLLSIALLNGFAISKVIDGSFRSAKYAFFLYLLELVLIILSVYTGFGIRLTPPSP